MYSLTKADMATDEATLAWLYRRIPEGSWVLQEYAPATPMGQRLQPYSTEAATVWGGGCNRMG